MSSPLGATQDEFDEHWATREEYLTRKRDGTITVKKEWREEFKTVSTHLYYLLHPQAYYAAMEAAGEEAEEASWAWEEEQEAQRQAEEAEARQEAYQEDFPHNGQPMD